jgi:geranylgeranyl diphosphate synthase type I
MTTMQWSAAVLAFVRDHPYLEHWADADLVLEGFEPSLRSSLPTALPSWTCYAAGGDPHQAIPLGAAFTLLHMAASVLDDFQDQDTDDAWTSWPLDRVLASVLAMVFLSQSCLARLNAPAETKQEVLDGFSQGWMLATAGQAQPVTAAQPVLSYLRHALAKSSLGFAVAARSGVRLVTNDDARLRAAQDYGMALGTLLQLADDFHDFHAAPLAASPSALSASLPVVLARQQSTHPANTELEALLARDDAARDSIWAREVCRLVTEIGGLAQTVGIAKVYEHKALVALAAFEGERVVPLADYVRSILATDAA